MKAHTINIHKPYFIWGSSVSFHRKLQAHLGVPTGHSITFATWIYRNQEFHMNSLKAMPISRKPSSSLVMAFFCFTWLFTSWLLIYRLISLRNQSLGWGHLAARCLCDIEKSASIEAGRGKQKLQVLQGTSGHHVVSSQISSSNSLFVCRSCQPRSLRFGSDFTRSLERVRLLT